MLKVSSVPSFDRAAKKLHAKDKKTLDDAVRAVAGDPSLGEEKKGGLANVFVYKFKINKQEVLLAYFLRPDKYKPNEIVLMALGSHENFYVDLKRSL